MLAVSAANVDMREFAPRPLQIALMMIDAKNGFALVRQPLRENTVATSDIQKGTFLR